MSSPHQGEPVVKYLPVYHWLCDTLTHSSLGSGYPHWMICCVGFSVCGSSIAKLVMVAKTLWATKANYPEDEAADVYMTKWAQWSQLATKWIVPYWVLSTEVLCIKRGSIFKIVFRLLIYMSMPRKCIAYNNFPDVDHVNMYQIICKILLVFFSFSSFIPLFISTIYINKCNGNKKVNCYYDSFSYIL